MTEDKMTEDWGHWKRDGMEEDDYRMRKMLDDSGNKPHTSKFPSLPEEACASSTGSGS